MDQAGHIWGAAWAGQALLNGLEGPKRKKHGLNVLEENGAVHSHIAADRA